MATDTGKAIARTGLVLGLGHFGVAGYIIGGVLGTVLFPPDPPGAPDPYTEVSLHSASSRIPIALMYGTVKHQGNAIFKGGLRYKKVEEGGKGGQKTVTGYKYWTDAGIGICKGKVDITRMWKDQEKFIHENDSAVTVHRGLPDEVVDPDLDALVDQAVPYRNLAWTMYRNFYLGEGNNRFPVMSSEVHRYPWTDQMNTDPFIYNRVNENTVGGVTLKDKFDEIIVIDGEGSPDTVKIYNNDWVLQHTIDISGLGITDEWDACLTYVGNSTHINIAMVRAGTISKQRVTMFRFSKTVGELNLSGMWVNTASWDLLDNEWANDLHITTNLVNNFIAVRWAGVGRMLKTSANNPGNLLGNYAIATAADITCNLDYVFTMAAGGIQILDFTGVLKDTQVFRAPGGADYKAIVAMYGGPHVICYTFGYQKGPSEWEDTIAFYTYDETTEQFENQSVAILDVDPYWASGATPFRGTTIVKPSLYEGPDGTIIASAIQSGGAHTIHMIVDANPANIIWDLFTVIREVSGSRIDAPALQTIGQRCTENRIGMSFRLLKKKNIGAIARDILGHLQGQVFRNNLGQFSFFMPSSSDVSVATIKLADIVVSQNDGAPDFAIVQTTNKDIGLCPNRLNVTYVNRLNGYKEDATFQLDDMLSQDADGELIEEELNYQMFSNPSVISKLAWKAWKISRYQNRMHEMLLNGRWLRLKHGNVITLNIPEENLNNVRVRVFAIDDPPSTAIGTAAVKITFQMDDDYLTSFEDIDYEASLSQETDIGPAVETTPVIWEEDARYNNDVLTIAITAIRTDDATAYNDVYISLDTPDSFVYKGRMTQFANVGDLVSAISDIDTKMTVNTDPYEGSTFPTYGDNNQLNRLSYLLMGELQADDPSLSELEFLTYQEAEVSGSNLILKNLERGVDYTLPKSHDTDAVVLHVGRDYFTKTYDAMWVGKKIYIKLVPANAKGDTLNLNDVKTWEYTIQGYSRHATHVDGLEIYSGGKGQGSKIRVADSDIAVRWEKTNRNDGMGRATLDAWEWQSFVDGDVDDYDIIVYQSDGVTVQAEHLGVGLVTTYTYTNAENTTDFGGSPSDHFWLGVRPVVTGRGPVRGVPDIDKQEIIRV